jgi:hypothetical protein
MSSFHYFLYFSSPFANFAKGLETRLSLSPATLFSGASLPNHTKMFELVHLVTSMDDFGQWWASTLWTSRYVPCVCKSVATPGVDRYPGSECAGGGGGDQHYGPLGMFPVCVRAWGPAGLTTIRGQSVRATVVGINIRDL